MPHYSCACIHYNGIIVASQGIADKTPMALQGFTALPPTHPRLFSLDTVAARPQLFDCMRETAL